MSEKFRLDHKIGFQNTFYTKCINFIIDSIGPSIILRSIYEVDRERATDNHGRFIGQVPIHVTKIASTVDDQNSHSKRSSVFYKGFSF